MKIKNGLTLKYLNDKINRQQKEIRELRSIVFKWGERDRLELEELKSKLKEMKT